MSDAEQPTVADVRAAVDAVKAALDRHLDAVEQRTRGAGEDEAAAGAADAAVYSAFDELAAAGELYDELLYEVHDEVTPFEIPGGETMPAYTGPEVPSALSVFIRRDYTITHPQRLLSQAQRVTDLDPDSVEGSGVERTAAGGSLNAALGVLFGEYEADEVATRHAEFGLDEGDSTLWVSAVDEPAEPGEWLSAPFEQADPAQVICRFDVSSVFDEDELYPLGPESGPGAGIPEAGEPEAGEPDILEVDDDELGGPGTLR